MLGEAAVGLNPRRGLYRPGLNTLPVPGLRVFGPGARNDGGGEEILPVHLTCRHANL